MATTKMTRKGQVTIPIEIRERLHLSEGDVLSVSEQNGKVVLESQMDIVHRLLSALPASGTPYAPISGDRVDDEVGAAIEEEYLTTDRRQ